MRHEDIDLYKVSVTSDVITVVNIKVKVFWYVTLCSFVRFLLNTRTYLPHYTV